MTSADAVAALEARLLAVEDRLAIIDLLNAYGPLVDSGRSGEAAELWEPGGGYSFSGGVGDGSRVRAPEGLVEVYESEWHRSLIATGSAHVTSPPVISVDGDVAEAVATSFVVATAETGGWSIIRAAANHWRLQRTAAGWRITERANQLLDGSAASHDLLALVVGLRSSPRHSSSSTPIADLEKG